MSAQSGRAILEQARGAGALLFGPGLGGTADTAALLELLGPGAAVPWCWTPTA